MKSELPPGIYWCLRPGHEDQVCEIRSVEDVDGQAEEIRFLSGSSFWFQRWRLLYAPTAEFIPIRASDRYKLSERKTVHQWLTDKGIPSSESTGKPMCLLRRLAVALGVAPHNPEVSPEGHEPTWDRDGKECRFCGKSWHLCGPEKCTRRTKGSQ